MGWCYLRELCSRYSAQGRNILSSVEVFLNASCFKDYLGILRKTLQRIFRQKQVLPLLWLYCKYSSLTLQKIPEAQAVAK